MYPSPQGEDAKEGNSCQRQDVGEHFLQDGRRKSVQFDPF